jgi:hypothetical protein
MVSGDCELGLKKKMRFENETSVLNYYALLSRESQHGKYFSVCHYVQFHYLMEAVDFLLRRKLVVSALLHLPHRACAGQFCDICVRES